MLTLRLLGGFMIESERGQLAGRAAQKKRLALLPLLATAPAGRLSRDRLIGCLWAESDTEHARHQLASSVYELRKALGEDAILSVGDDLQLNPEAVHSDVAAFEEAHRRGEWGHAVALYRGPFLEGFFLDRAREFERWSENERQRLARLYASALKALAEAAQRCGDPEGMVEWWRRLTEHDPYSSRFALRLMQALEAVGDRAGALQQARVHQLRVRTELEIGPDPEISALAERLRAERAPDDERIPTPPSEGLRSRVAPPRPEAHSIGVLPFADLSPRRGRAYFSDGVTDELINTLTGVEGLRVAARTSVFSLRNESLGVQEVARRLQATYILEGSVRRSGGRVRISARLVDAETGFPLWSDTFDRELSDGLAIQQEIAHTIVAALEPELARKGIVGRGTTDTEAYNLYLIVAACPVVGR
jgi:TolB-like protein/transposase-like protein